ncbi:MAG TPA: protein kinase, partial [Byssovorax sp.]
MKRGALRLPPRYEIARQLGKGGGGEVWAARDRISDRRVAIKVLAENAHEREAQALVREAVALSGVEGLGVPRVLRFGRLAGSNRPYMVRELVEGDSLAGRLEAGADVAGLVAALAQATDQLARLHRALLLHGDIKPANIIVDDAGRATLVDLGLAATWREGGATPQGLTPKFAAPELFQGAPLTVRAEVFALGATLASLLAEGRGLDAGARVALEQVAATATRADAGERYPSADEFRSALARAAGLRDSKRDGGPPAWPIVGLDAPASRLLGAVGALRPGGGLVVTGPAGSGRSTLLRRIAWSLGVEGRAVAWVTGADKARVREEIELELADLDAGEVVALVDDADALDAEDLARLDAARGRGGRLVLAVGVDAAADALPGATFEVFTTTPLDADAAGELVRRTVPSLGDAVVAHVVALADGRPGRLRAIVTRLEGAPVAAPADVDRLLERESTGPVTARDDIHRLLDRGHFEEAADVLARYEDDTSASIGVARARLLTNRGETARASQELERVEQEATSTGGALAASWFVQSSRAALRAGDYAEVERLTEVLLRRLDLPVLDASAHDAGAPTALAGGDVSQTAPFRQL